MRFKTLKNGKCVSQTWERRAECDISVTQRRMWEKRSSVSVQSESSSNVLVLMVALMFYYNQRYIQVLECFLMFSAQAEQYSAHTAQTGFIWFTRSALCYGIRMFNSLGNSQKAKSNKSRPDP